MEECNGKNCNAFIGFLEYYCDECTKKIAGKKPPKTKGRCRECIHDSNKKVTCENYKEAELEIKMFYDKWSYIPTPRWRLNCFEQNKKIGK